VTPAARRGSRTLLLGFGLLAVLASGPAFAQDSPVPPEIQAVIFKKLFVYVRTLPSGSTPKLLIVYDEGSAKLKDEMRKAFGQVGIDAQAVLESELSSRVADGAVVYVTTQRGSFKQVLQKNRLLSISGIPALVERGDVSIGLTLQNAQPKILVNLAELKAEGHEVASNLLQLAKVIQ